MTVLLIIDPSDGRNYPMGKINLFFWILICSILKWWPIIYHRARNEIANFDTKYCFKRHRVPVASWWGGFKSCRLKWNRENLVGAPGSRKATDYKKTSWTISFKARYIAQLRSLICWKEDSCRSSPAINQTGIREVLQKFKDGPHITKADVDSEIDSELLPTADRRFFNDCPRQFVVGLS